MNKTEIKTAAENIFNRLSEACYAVTEKDFFIPLAQNKWSVAENVEHLIISTNTSTLAFTLPRFVVRWVAGIPKRSSRSFEELKTEYYKKLNEGGKASGRFVPASIRANYSKQKLIDNWNKATARFIKALVKNRTEKDLDNYLVKHPLLGRITLRELCYFTVFHTVHHLNCIKKTAAIV